MTQFVYAFNEGNIAMKDLLGGKGANLSEMKRLGLPVPDGFTITTEACITYLKQNEELPTEVKTQLIDHLAAFSKRTGKAFSSDDNLLLVSVRSGAKISMPGMMDTTVTGINSPFSPKTCVIPIFLPKIPLVIESPPPILFYYNLISMSTPDGKFKPIRASTVLGVGLTMSIKRL